MKRSKLLAVLFISAAIISNHKCDAGVVAVLAATPVGVYVLLGGFGGIAWWFKSSASDAEKARQEAERLKKMAENNAEHQKTKAENEKTARKNAEEAAKQANELKQEEQKRQDSIRGQLTDILSRVLNGQEETRQLFSQLFKELTSIMNKIMMTLMIFLAGIAALLVGSGLIVWCITRRQKTTLAGTSTHPQLSAYERVHHGSLGGSTNDDTQPDLSNGSLGAGTENGTGTGTVSLEAAGISGFTLFPLTQENGLQRNQRPNSINYGERVRQGLQLAMPTRQEHLGGGAFSSVYRCSLHHEGETLQIAAKAIRMLKDNMNKLSQIIKEIMQLQSIQHDHIIRYYGWALRKVGEDTGCQQHDVEIYMELGVESLRSHLEKEGPLDKNTTVIFTDQILDALAYLHSRRTVHRDIKCHNILLASRDVIKLADFGSNVEIRATITGQTAWTMSKGDTTLLWTAPEALQPDKRFKNSKGPSSRDLWSVGCCVVEMLTGKAPHEDDFLSRQDAVFIFIFQLRTRQLDYDPSKLVPSASKKMKHFLSKLLQYEVEDRVEDAEAARALMRALGLLGIAPVNTNQCNNQEPINSGNGGASGTANTESDNESENGADDDENDGHDDENVSDDYQDARDTGIDDDYKDARDDYEDDRHDYKDASDDHNNTGDDDHNVSGDSNAGFDYNNSASDDDKNTGHYRSNSQDDSYNNDGTKYNKTDSNSAGGNTQTKPHKSQQ